MRLTKLVAFGILLPAVMIAATLPSRNVEAAGGAAPGVAIGAIRYDATLGAIKIDVTWVNPPILNMPRQPTVSVRRYDYYNNNDMTSSSFTPGGVNGGNTAVLNAAPGGLYVITATMYDQNIQPVAYDYTTFYVPE